MTIYDIWNKICAHQVTGLMYHFQFADMFYFLGLENLGKSQECRYRKESETLRKNHCFVLKHHGKILMQKHAEGVDIIPSSWSKYTASDVDKSTRKSQVTAIFDSWFNWELQTKELYTDMYNKAKEQLAIVDACRIRELLLAVEDEIVHIRSCVQTLNMHDYSTEAMLSL